MSTIRGREAMLKLLWEDFPEAIEGFRAKPQELADLGNDGILVVARYEGRGRDSDMAAPTDSRIVIA